jgi:hypothetical protein
MPCNSGLTSGQTRFAPAKSGSVANLALFQKFTDFMDWFEPIVERFPAYERFALCTNIKQTMNSIMELIIETNATKNKVAGWFRVDVKLEVLRTYVHRSRRKGSKYLSKRSYETAVKKLSEVGRLLGGLIKKERVADV